MAKISETQTAPRLCPTCGTRAGAAATKCLVCGADLSRTAEPKPGRAGAASGRAMAAAASVRGPGAWLFVVLLIVLVLAGVGLVLFASGKGLAILASPTPTITLTFTSLPTFTATPTATDTLEPSATPLPPTPYVVKTGDQCGIIAANFDVSIASIIAINHLDPNCLLTVGKTIMVPQPTPTPTPLPTATLPGGLATVPPPFTHTVVSGETCGGIAKAFKINLADLIAENGLKADCTIRPGQILVVPFPAPVGPTPTETLPPPYPAPKQLLPADGQQFLKPEDNTVTLQWASVGELQPNESYYVVVEDVTCRCARFYKQYVTETKLIVPQDYRPNEAAPHLFRWNVTTVRQTNAGAPGQPIYDPAGATSTDSDFIWSGAAGAAATPSP
jgi:LysM repeat protein